VAVAFNAAGGGFRTPQSHCIGARYIAAPNAAASTGKRGSRAGGRQVIASLLSG
jgi:hypothetical protein